MTEETHQDCRLFVSYSGVKLPFNLVNAIAAPATSITATARCGVPKSSCSKTTRRGRGADVKPMMLHTYRHRAGPRS